MAKPRQILIADPHLESMRLLSRAIRERGHRIHYAPDGSQALALAVLRHPDLALFDEECGLVEARTFAQILRSNPRTAKIPIVLLAASPKAGEERAFPDGVLKKPVNLDEVLARIDQLFRRGEAAGELRSDSEIDGHLSQLGIPDLLQFLAINKRSGKVVLGHCGERGEIHIGGGRPLNARIGATEGEKALFRLLTWTEGTFSFTPGPPPARARVDRSMEDALLEGMRHLDELARLRPSLPPRNARIQLASHGDLPKDRSPVTSQVLELLGQPRTLSELVDLVPATDLDVLSALSILLQKGVVRIAECEPDEVKAGPLLVPAEVHALRARLLRGRSPSQTAVAKVFVCGHGPETSRRVLSGVPGLRPVAVEPPAANSGFGTLGRYEVSEALHVDFCMLPTAEAAKPLWRPFSAGAVGALVLDTSGDSARMANWLATEARLPVVAVGGAPAGAVAVETDLLEALRAVLIQSLHPLRPIGSPLPVLARTPI
jgi:CheY-like chemotaxis protein